MDVYNYPSIIEYYKEVNHYKKSQFQVSNMVLKMEFYLVFLDKFCSLEKLEYDIFMGNKTMHAMKVSSQLNWYVVFIILDFYYSMIL